MMLFPSSPCFFVFLLSISRICTVSAQLKTLLEKTVVRHPHFMMKSLLIRADVRLMYDAIVQLDQKSAVADICYWIAAQHLMCDIKVGSTTYVEQLLN